jgi:hypothetical protein
MWCWRLDAWLLAIAGWKTARDAEACAGHCTLRGEYPNATNTQDDLAIMMTYVPAAADDHGDSISTATPLSSGFVTPGIIGVADAADWFQITAQAGPLSIAVNVVAPWGTDSRSNLDVLLTLTTAAGQVIESINAIAVGDPMAALPASMAVSLAQSGTYYISVRKTGYGDPTTTGYSTYGVNGQYSITATYTQSAHLLPPARHLPVPHLPRPHQTRPQQPQHSPT